MQILHLRDIWSYTMSFLREESSGYPVSAWKPLIRGFQTVGPWARIGTTDGSNLTQGRALRGVNITVKSWTVTVLALHFITLLKKLEVKLYFLGPKDRFLEVLCNLFCKYEWFKEGEYFKDALLYIHSLKASYWTQLSLTALDFTPAEQLQFSLLQTF